MSARHVPNQRASGLAVDELVVKFGGLTAVDGQTLEAPLGRITGLIGPNGAGKTTTFNACTGLVRAARGRITLFGEDISHLSPPARARRGLGRTFQRMELYDTLSVRENVFLGREARLAGSNPFEHLRSSRAQKREVAGRADAAMEMCGIGDLSTRTAADLSTGQRRLVELARCIAGGFSMMLLDEPSSGLDEKETAEFGDVLVRLTESPDVGILIVEHDMSLVMTVCSYLYVMDFGHPIFEGTPVEVASSPLVQSAYLGSEADELKKIEEPVR